MKREHLSAQSSKLVMLAGHIASHNLYDIMYMYPVGPNNDRDTIKLIKFSAS